MATVLAPKALDPGPEAAAAEIEHNRLKNDCGDTSEGCSSSSIEDNHTKAVATNWLLGAAGVSLLTGIIVYATAVVGEGERGWRACGGTDPGRQQHRGGRERTVLRSMPPKQHP